MPSPDYTRSSEPSLPYQSPYVIGAERLMKYGPLIPPPSRKRFPL